MNLRARLGGEELDLGIHRHGVGRYTVSLPGRTLELDLTEPEPGVFSLRVGDGSFEAVVRRVGDEWNVSLAGRAYPVAILDPAVVARGGSMALTGTQVIRSVMAGKVLEVMVKEGEAVALGRPLLVIEAMKMENEIRAPKEGTVRSIAVRPGQAVEVGADLVVVE